MLVSAIIPTFNRARTIERAVNSVLNQTWKKIEVIVVDDGSTDQTVEILKTYRGKIRVICQKNGGASAARNTGIKAATGEIISFLDSDDEWLPEKTERQVQLLQRTESSGITCCVCDSRMVRSSGTATSFQLAGLRPRQTEGVWSNPAQILMDRFLLFNQVAAIRREALDRCGYFREDLKIMEDYDLALRLALNGPWAFIAIPLAVWHEDAGSGLSRNVSQLAKCHHALMILRQLSSSAQFGAHFRALSAQGRLNRRLRLLSNEVRALNLSNESNAFAKMLGKSLHLYLRGSEALYRRLPFLHRMITNPV